MDKFLDQNSKSKGDEKSVDAPPKKQVQEP